MKSSIFFITAFFMLLNTPPVEANSFQEGATYQINRAYIKGNKFPICTTSEAASAYSEAAVSRDKKKMRSLILPSETTDQVAQLKGKVGCIFISSSSQVQVAGKDASGNIQGIFAAFPFMKMWTNYMHVGGLVR